MEAFRASITPLMAPPVRQIEASTAAITASTAPLAQVMRQVMRQVETSEAPIRRATASGTAFSDLWLIYRQAGDENARLQAADRTLARFGGFIYKQAYARMQPELLAQAEAHGRSAQQELHARAQAALFDTAGELSDFSRGLTMAGALHVWRNRVERAVIEDVLGDHWRRRAVPRQRGHAELHVWLELEFALAAPHLTDQERALGYALGDYRNLRKAAQVVGLSYPAAKQTLARLRTKLKSA
jgi:hypothetical protein